MKAIKNNVLELIVAYNVETDSQKEIQMVQIADIIDPYFSCSVVHEETTYNICYKDGDIKHFVNYDSLISYLQGSIDTAKMLNNKRKDF